MQMKAVKNFKKLIEPSTPTPMQSILGQDHESHFVEPPMEMEPDEALTSDIPDTLDKDQSLSAINQKLHERNSVAGSDQRDGRDRKRQFDSTDSISVSSKRDSVKYTASIRSERKDSGSVRSVKRRGDSSDDVQAVSSGQSASPKVPLSRASSATTKRSVEGTRGHARDPLEEEYPYLFIGPSTYSSLPIEQSESNPDSISEEPESISPPELSDPDTATDTPIQIVSESPGAAEFDIYETAYRQEVERIHKRSHTLQAAGPKVYLTRRVEGKDDVMKLVGEDGSSEITTSHEPRSRTMPALGAKLPLPAGPQPSIGGIQSLLAKQREQQQKAPDSESAPDHHPQFPPSTADTTSDSPAETTSPDTQAVPENSRAKLRNLLGRVRGSRG